MTKRVNGSDWQRYFTVGDRYRCTLTMTIAPGGTPSGLRVEWEPDFPHDLSDFEIADYRRQRDACLAEWQQQTGFGVALIEA